MKGLGRNEEKEEEYEENKKLALGKIAAPLWRDESLIVA